MQPSIPRTDWPDFSQRRNHLVSPTFVMRRRLGGVLSGYVWHFMAVAKKSDLHADTPLSIPAGVHDRPRKPGYDAAIVASGIGALAPSALFDGLLRVPVMARRKSDSGSSLAGAAMIQHEIEVQPPARRSSRRRSTVARIPSWCVLPTGRRLQRRSGAFQS